MKDDEHLENNMSSLHYKKEMMGGVRVVDCKV